MIDQLINWIRSRFSTDEQSSPANLRKYEALPAARRKMPTISNKPDSEHVDFEDPTNDNGTSASPPLIKNRYVREDTGTHETLKILDDSIVESGEEPGIDPYNTGGFDRSKNWNNRFRQ